MGRAGKIGWRMAALAALLLAAPLSLRAAGEDEKPVARSYHTAPAAMQGETEEQAHAKSAGCESCHTASDAPSMHKSSAVVLGCADCHGGDATVMAGAGLQKGTSEYAALRDRAHVLPRYPKAWRFPSSANPQQSYTLLNREAPQFVRFVNPSDYRVVRESCGACHLELIQKAERSLMSTGAMFLEGATYNNGVFPNKAALLGEAYTSKGEPARVLSPGAPPGAVTPEQKD